MGEKSGRERVGGERGKSLTLLFSSFLLDLKKEAAENERKRRDIDREPYQGQEAVLMSSSST